MFGITPRVHRPRTPHGLTHPVAAHRYGALGTTSGFRASSSRRTSACRLLAAFEVEGNEVAPDSDHTKRTTPPQGTSRFSSSKKLFTRTYMMVAASPDAPTATAPGMRPTSSRPSSGVTSYTPLRALCKRAVAVNGAGVCRTKAEPDPMTSADISAPS